MNSLRRLLCRFGFHCWAHDAERQMAWDHGYVTFERCLHCSARKAGIGDLA